MFFNASYRAAGELFHEKKPYVNEEKRIALPCNGALRIPNKRSRKKTKRKEKFVKNNSGQSALNSNLIHSNVVHADPYLAYSEYGNTVTSKRVMLSPFLSQNLVLMTLCYTKLPSVLRIHDILVRIRILLFSSLTFKMPAKY
jgi:hypothetical protein